MKKVSIVILNWNGCEMLRTFLPSVIRYSDMDGIEICVADNGSTDASIEMLQMEFPAVRTILLDRNWGFADGYNKALELIDAEYVVLLNSDVEVTPDWLLPLTTYMDQHPEVAACQPKIRSQRRKDLFEHAGAAGGYIDRYGYPFCRGRIFSNVEVDKGQYDDIKPIFWATGAALFIRLADFRAVGRLDGRFFAHMEEIDLCWRLHARGYAIVCIPQSIVYHVGGATLNKENPRKTYLNFRNNLIMLYKNLPSEEFTQVMRTRCFLDYLAMLQYLLKFDLPNVKAIYKARSDFKKQCKDYLADRLDNLQKTSTKIIPEQINNSILWQFYAQGRKHFNQLTNFKD